MNHVSPLNKKADTFKDTFDDRYIALIRGGQFDEALALLRERKHVLAMHLKESNGGSVLGIEASNSSGTLWAAILPEVSDVSRPVRILRYGSNGFFGHSCYGSENEALAELISEGFIVPDTGALQRLQAAPEWAAGMEALQRIAAAQSPLRQARQRGRPDR